MLKTFLKWLMKWGERFWDNHGERLTFAAMAVIMACFFLIVGMKNEELKEFIGAGTTILIGVAMLFFNKTRSETKPPTEEKGEIADEQKK